ncbi:MAG: aldehyde ferredoxin oxidoreductase family protein [Candidatus Aminicenantaceae bacterium]
MNHPSFFGHHSKILNIDLSKNLIQSKSLDPAIVEDYLGGRGLATRIFYDEINPECDPLAEDNVLVIATSLLIGTRAPTACRGHMVFKSPLTGLIGSSNCGGTWANVFKSSGYDVLVIKGKAAEPVTIDICPDEVKIISAKHLWGLDVHDTTKKLSTKSEAGKRPSILCIGPAGENLVLISSVMNDKNRAYGRAGSGAVFGSKNLKSITVSGKKKVQIKDSERFQSGRDQALYLMKAAPITKRLLRELGTSGLLKLINIIDMLPHKNFQDNLHKEKDLEKISGETLRKKILERAGGCFGCPIACQRHTRTGDKNGEGPEYETIVMTGLDCGIYNLEAITNANYCCNELGVDTISFGGTLACAMELFEKGFLSTKETEGAELRFGNAKILREMVKLTAYRKGIGDKLAEGSFRLASFFKHPEFSMTVKKLEIPAYDPRTSFTQALGYMTSPTGACHLRGGYAVSLAFFGGTREIPRFSLLQSPIAIRNMQNLGIIQDSLGICRFTGFAFPTEPWSRMASGVTGMDFSTSRLEEIANRVATLERIFNLEAGMNPEDDTLPDRFSTEPVLVEGKEKLLQKKVIKRMRNDYYEVRGWDVFGIPPQTLLRALKIKGRKK